MVEAVMTGLAKEADNKYRDLSDLLETLLDQSKSLARQKRLFFL